MEIERLSKTARDIEHLSTEVEHHNTVVLADNLLL
jgi:hypothetical protein